MFVGHMTHSYCACPNNWCSSNSGVFQRLNDLYQIRHINTKFKDLHDVSWTMANGESKDLLYRQHSSW